jgi:Holliday junction resolvase-like predicted endonuclease
VELSRLIDARHAAIVERVVACLTSLGWQTVVEYSFNHFGERGLVDILAWRAVDRALLIVEIKSERDDLQQLLGVLDRKTRLVPKLVALDRGWKAAILGVVLVLPECSTSRFQVDRYRATFAAALPARNVEVRRWIRSPGAGSPLRGIWFLQSSGGAALMEGGRGRGGPRRVRAGREAAGRWPPGGERGPGRAESRADGTS